MRRVRWGLLWVPGLAIALLGVSGEALAGHHGKRAYATETAYVVETVPTAYVVSTSTVAVPTSYVVPTAYVVEPTAYVVEPASYVATSYVLDPAVAYVRPSVVPTTYVAPSIVPTVLVTPTTYVAPSVVPTVLVTPTTYVTETVASAGVACAGCPVTPTCCSTAPATTMAATAPAPGTSSASGPARGTPSTVESVPANEPRAPAAAANDPATTRRNTMPSTGAGSGAGAAADPNFATPPEAPAREKEPVPAPPAPADNLTPITPGGDAGGQPATSPAPPVAPGGDAAASTTDAATRHQALKPVAPTAGRYLRSAPKGDLHRLQGKVVSRDTGRPEEGVPLRFVNREGFVARRATTDTLGRYTVELPDGDWTVDVTMPSGNVYAVSRLTVQDGQIRDDLGRDIPSLIINR